MAETLYKEKSALLFSEGEYIEITADEKPLRFAVFSAPPLNEPVAWGGPIVMNTEDELKQAFADLEMVVYKKTSPALGKMIWRVWKFGSKQ